MKLVRIHHYNSENRCHKGSMVYLYSEKASIDEVFIDFSIPVRDILLERYPHLTCPPPDSSGGLDTPLPPPPRISNVGLGNLIPIDPSKFDSEKDVTTELVEEIEKDQPITWHDIALTIAAELMAKMRGVVHKELGYLTSAVKTL